MEKIYGFVDKNNRLINTCVAIENDIETLDRIKEENNAIAYYAMNLDKELLVPDIAYWNGTRFIWDSPFPSWIWNEDINNWLPPIEIPNEPAKEGFFWNWNEETLSWEENAVIFEPEE